MSVLFPTHVIILNLFFYSETPDGEQRDLVHRDEVFEYCKLIHNKIQKIKPKKRIIFYLSDKDYRDFFECYNEEFFGFGDLIIKYPERKITQNWINFNTSQYCETYQKFLKESAKEIEVGIYRLNQFLENFGGKNG